MTRTERATYPRAISKDRSEAKNGFNKSDKKNGAGPHNWGSMKRERDYEEGAIRDEEFELEEQEEEGDATASRAYHVDRAKPELPRGRSLTEEELEDAKRLRMGALKQGADLGSIARTSAAVSVSPPNKTVPIANQADTSIMDASGTRAY